MARVRTGSTMIRTGSSRIMQRQPPQRATTQTRRSSTQKEIGFIAESKKLEEAKSRKDRRGKEPLTINDIVQGVKDRNLQDAESGYVLTQAGVSAELKAMLTPELLSWFDNRVQDYRKLMAECQAKYKAELEKVKEKHGKDPIRYTRERLKLKAKVYPSWSKQSQHATEEFKERQDKLAKAITGAKAKGVKGLSYDELYTMATTTKASAKKQAKEKGVSDEQLAAIRGEKYVVEKLPTITTTTEESPVVLNATEAEIEAADKAKAEADERGWSCYTSIAIFRVKTKDGRTILVEALDSPSKSGSARAREKAQAAGYEVTWVTRQLPSDKPPTSKTITQMEPGATVTLTGTEIPRGWRMASAEIQESMGIEKVDGQYQQEVIATAEGQFIPKEVYDALPDNYQALIVEKGMDAYQEAAEADQTKFQNWLKDLKNDYPDLYKVYEEKGYDALQDAINQQSTKQQNVIATLDNKYKLDDGYDITAALTDKAVTASDLKLAGFKDSDINTAAEAAGQVMQNRNKLEKDFLALPLQKKLAGFPGVESQEWYINELNVSLRYMPGESELEGPYSKLSNDEKARLLDFYAHTRPEYWAERAKETGKVALAFVPIAGTVAYWDDMSPTWKAISIATDILCISFIAKAATAGARAVRGYTAASRVRGALKAAGEAVLAEAVAPIDMAAHPIATARGIGRQVQSTIETLIHPKKLPIGATELAYTTTRLPIDDVGGAKKAMELRDTAVAAAIQGKPGKATIGDITLELTPAELQKVGGPLAVHATPDVRPYLNGAVIQGGAEGSGMFISPNFHSRFAQATAFGDMPEGGIKGGLLIRDQNVLNALAPTGKTYMSTAEIEALLRPGTTLPAPSQVLFTRDVAGNKLTFLVIGKPYTRSQIAKLKFLGSLDTVGQVFKPTMTLTGTEKTAINAMDDIIELSSERARLTGQLEAARAAGKAEVIRNLNQRISKLDDQIDNLIKRVNAPREAIRPDNLLWAQYAAKGVLERYQELDPKRVTATDRGTRLPDVRPAMALRAAVPLTRGRLTGEEPYVSVSYQRGKPTGYAPGYTPSYVPAKAPPYAPVKLPSKPPVPTPPYTPAGVSVARPVRVAMSEKPTKPARKSPALFKMKREKVPRQPARLVSWRQGRYWITIVDPFRSTGTKPDVLFSRHKPPWGKVSKGRYSPQRTLRSLGKVPQTIRLPMGATTAVVKRGRIIKFKAA